MAATVEITLPDGLREALAGRLPSEAAIPRWLLESALIEAYRERQLSRGALGELLGLSFHECETLLHERGVPHGYDLEDLEQDSRALDSILVPAAA